jgi:ATP-dependent Lhr-like helicase
MPNRSSDSGKKPLSLRQRLNALKKANENPILPVVRVVKPGPLPKPVKDGLSTLRDWFGKQGYKPFPYQEEAWQQFRAGHSGLINVPTGAGKTYSAYFGPLSELLENPQDGLQILIITPLRALSRDMEKALSAPLIDLKLNFRVESRTGDASAALRARQKKLLPQILITTPESLNLLLSYEEAETQFSKVKAVILDEWHELLSSKRGIQVELAMARIRRFSSNVRTWALSATIANLEEAALCAVGSHNSYCVVTGSVSRPITIDSLIPAEIDSFPWAGHLGKQMLDQLVEAIDIDVSTLIFTNVRSHAERWYQDILDARPEWAGLMALHHGSLDRRSREFVEEGLKSGYIKLVICTSSLDLGVDFAPVERVFQIGSPKGIARMIQRAGRSSHRPGMPCKITSVPTQALELAEVVAVRHAIKDGRIEPRYSLNKPLDVLVQHLVTCALGGGFKPQALYKEIKTAYSYCDLTKKEFDWVMQLVRDGGQSLTAYPEYHKIELKQGFYVVPDVRLARLHRLNIGTITSSASMTVAFVGGKKLGSVEESFISKLQKGDVFTFAGRMVEFVMVRDMTAFVRVATKKSNVVPRWDGGRFPLSASLADEIRQVLERSAGQATNKIQEEDPEIGALAPILDAQRAISLIPKSNELLAEQLKTRYGYHLFLYPFEGRLVHEGLAALLAYRMSQTEKLTFQMTVNDYGIEFLSTEVFPYEEYLTKALFTLDHLTDDLIGSMNMSELARRQFRDIARIANLVYQNHPGSHKTSRQLQTSSTVLYDVFNKFDPNNLLLAQAQREVLERQFEQSRLATTLKRLLGAKLKLVKLKRPSPLCFPLMAERVGGRLRVSNESMGERIAKMQRQWMSK